MINKIEDWHNAHEGERCFVFGTSPSICQIDVSKAIDEHCFVANWFTIHELYPQMKKVFHCISSPTPWWTGRLSPLFYNLSKSNLLAKRFWDASFEYPNRKYHYFDDSDIEYVKLIPRVDENQIPVLNFDLTKSVWIMGTVILDIILPVVYYLGFDEIYLVGIDNNHQLDKHPDWSNSHFYSLDWMPLWLRQHLQGGASKGIRPHSLDKEYIAYKTYFEKHGRTILNATKGGTLDIFDVVDFDSLFEK